jgi:hypothetical protein
MLVDRLDALQRKHKDLAERVEVLEAERAPDEVVQNVKKEKLAVKDEIARVMEQIDQNSVGC